MKRYEGCKRDFRKASVVSIVALILQICFCIFLIFALVL